MEDDEKSIENFKCPICLDLLHLPVSFECTHSFCRECIKDYLRHQKLSAKHLRSRNNIQKNLKIDVKCPMCGQLAVICVDKLEVNRNLEKEIKRLHRNECSIRIRQVRNEMNLRKSKNYFNQTLLIGNTHKKLKKSRYKNCKTHSWTMFVKFEGKGAQKDRFIERVEFNLHPTYKRKQVIKRSRPFKIDRIGWGTFEVGVVVKFIKKFKDDLVMDHLLSFDDGGSFSRNELTFKAEKKKIPPPKWR